MGGCSAINCSNHSRKKHRMFKFPKDKERRAIWANNCRRKCLNGDDWEPGPNAQLCISACSDAMGSSGQQLEENATTGWNWSESVVELHWMWELHVWVSASLFSVLAVLCLFTVLRLRSQLSHSKNLTSLNVFLGILASSRLLVLYLDPYGSKLILPAVMLQVLWDLGYPCLVSAFCLLQLSVAKVTRLSENTASIIITFHFCLIITSGVLGAVHSWLRVVWIVTQVVFIVWGVFLFVSTLLGCLRMLRSYVKLPVRLLTQADPGCEVNHPKPDHHHPGIHITDVDEQTYSYASDASLQHTLKRSESMPDKKKKKAPASPNEDPATIKPLIVSSLPEIHVLQDRARRNTVTEKNTVRGPATIFTFEPKQSLSPSVLPSILGENHPCRLERGLRHLVFSSSLGILLCLLRTYDVLGLDGLVACGKTGPLLQWFFFQTLSRFVELILAFSMVCGSQRSMNTRRHYYYN